jgi:hypothetical protein
VGWTKAPPSVTAGVLRRRTDTLDPSSAWKGSRSRSPRQQKRLFTGSFLSRLLDRASKDVSADAARRRGASRVPQMCPECVRMFSGLTTTKCRFAGAIGKPSDGLEPSTPSLPCDLRGNRSQPTATVFARLSRFRGRPICHQLPPVATALLFLKKGRVSNRRLLDGTSSGAPGRLDAHLFLGVRSAHRVGGSCPGFSIP